MTALSLYIHWPFCLSKCPYCDFNSHVSASIDIEAWRVAYTRNLRYWAELTRGRPIHTIYFGGGTPSLMPPSLVNTILATVKDLWEVSPECEITLEANPNSAEVQRFADFARAGVNRLSLGIQSLRPSALTFLGRGHNVEEALAAIRNAAQCFERYTFDLIYALPQQTPEEWQDELTQALQLARGHLSLYQLTIEPNTAFYMKYHRGDFHLPDEDQAAAFYSTTGDIMKSHGYCAYEVSNYCFEGQESRHNLCYWNYGDYVGVGPGAHGRITLDGGKYATVAERAPQTWLNFVTAQENGLKERVLVSRSEQLREILVMGLRLQKGVLWQRLQNFIHTQTLAETLTSDYLYSDGYLEIDAFALKATDRGRLVLNTVIARIVQLIDWNKVSG